MTTDKLDHKLLVCKYLFNVAKRGNVEIFSNLQERQIQNHGTSNSNYLTQLAKVENQCKDIFKQCSQVLATVDKVEANSKYELAETPRYFILLFNIYHS